MITPEIFLKLHYPEIKELTVTFLTLTSSIFTFSVVFAEKLARPGTVGKAAWIFVALCIVGVFYYGLDFRWIRSSKIINRC